MSTERYKHIEIQAPQEFPYQRETIVAYQAAFAGYPWFENLSVEEVLKRFNKYLSTPGFEGIWLIDQANGKPVAATWWTTPDLDTLEKERGSKLRTFIDLNFKISGENTIVIWTEETLVSPEYQRQGLATRAKDAAYRYLEQKANSDNKSILVLARMRDDNYGIIKVNERFGMQRTGIKVPSSQVLGLFHEYWYKVINPNE